MRCAARDWAALLKHRTKQDSAYSSLNDRHIDEGSSWKADLVALERKDTGDETLWARWMWRMDTSWKGSLWWQLAALLSVESLLPTNTPAE